MNFNDCSNGFRLRLFGMPFVQHAEQARVFRAKLRHTLVAKSVHYQASFASVATAAPIFKLWDNLRCIRKPAMRK
jgi:hypothetical protein